MKYDINFKLKCIELYNNGQWPDTPKGIGQKNFRKRIFNWVKTLELHGIEGLEHPLTCKERTAEERYALVARVLAGESQNKVALSAGIYSGLLSKWVQIYKMKGYTGLQLQKGRYKKEITMKKEHIPNELLPSEKEELIRLRAETKYLKTENEAIKKLIALRHEKEAAQLKAKKQQLLKNLKKKDIH